MQNFSAACVQHHFKESCSD